MFEQVNYMIRSRVNHLEKARCSYSSFYLKSSLSSIPSLLFWMLRCTETPRTLDFSNPFLSVALVRLASLLYYVLLREEPSIGSLSLLLLLHIENKFFLSCCRITKESMGCKPRRILVLLFGWSIYLFVSLHRGAYQVNNLALGLAAQWRRCALKDRKIWSSL